MKNWISNPAWPGGRIPVVTDRALRYRANANPPPGPRICHYCGSSSNIQIDHIDGREENGATENLLYACRSCNGRKGAFFARQGIGRRTRQYNPSGAIAARTVSRWLKYAGSLMGAGKGAGKVNPAAAIAGIQATSPGRRAAIAAELARRRKNPDPTFAQYLYAVGIHRRGSHDDGGKIIHATSKSKRREYARRIAEIRRIRGTSHLAGRRAGSDGEVPF